MDPYYQQQGGAGLPPPSQQQQQQQQQQPPQQAQASHHQVPQPPVQSGSGHSRAYSSSQRQQPIGPSLQQQQASAPGGYLDQPQQMFNPQMQSQQQPIAAGQPTSSHRQHHHGGQAPLPPGTGGHHGGRYGSHGSSRSAMMHQHRSSAAAISDPMMASTITDHLASASGPLSGSGSALNQLGAYNSSYRTGAGQTTDPITGQPIMHPLEQQHLSRYDQTMAGGGGYVGASGRSRSSGHHQSQLDPLGGSYLPGGPTTVGAYHLDRGLTSADDQRGYYPGQQQQHHHQSMGNLTASGRHLYGDGQQQRYSQLDGAEALLPPPSNAQRYYGSGYPTDTRLTTSDGLGSYDPLADPLANSMAIGQQHHHLQPAGAAHHQHHQGFVGGQGLGPLSGAQVGSIPQMPTSGGRSTEVYVAELRARLQEAQNSYAAVKRELETATQKLGSSMHSIKSFWSPELKKERALRKEEATRYALINDQMKLMRIEVQKQALLIRQLEEELRLAYETRIRTQDPDIQQHIDALCMEKESLFKENCLLRETIRELEMRIETQKQTLAARDDSIRKMVEMMNNKGIATKIMEDERMEADRLKTRNIELEARVLHYESILQAKEKDLIKRNTKPEEQRHQAPTANGEQQQQQQAGFGSLLSPIPRQRKSTRRPLSRIERVKNRTSSQTPANDENQPPSKERLNELLLSSSSSSNKSTQQQQQRPQLQHSDSQSSSGISSSRSSAEIQPMPSTSTAATAAATSSSSNRLACDEAKLCECSDCQVSGQQIYAVPQKKAVSFSANVEHINSNTPNSAGPLNDRVHFPEQPDATNDSLHCTKDWSASLLLDNFNQPQTDDHDEVDNQDYLRPLDCSTPKAMEPGEQLIRVEVHKQPGSDSVARAINMPQQVIQPQPQPRQHRPPDYTCLCAPDFMCVHNYPHLLQPKLQQVTPVIKQNLSAHNLNSSANLYARQLSTLSNEMYGRLAPINNKPQTANTQQQQSTTTAASNSDFHLSSNCVECKNLSTYVNLSATQQQHHRRTADDLSYHNLTQEPELMSFDDNVQLQSQFERPIATSTTDYHNINFGRHQEAHHHQHRQRLMQASKHEADQPIYSRSSRQSSTWLPQSATEEQYHYLSAARGLPLPALDDCELCRQQLQQYDRAASLHCSCPPRAAPNDRDPHDLSSTKSYHTAASSFGAAPDMISQQRYAPTINASELSVLPVHDFNRTRQPPAIQGTLETGANGVDSSLSSLFVYRHVSDDNQEFDPDSLEISRQQQQQNQQPVQQKQVQRRNAPGSDYIPLSSTTSTISAPNKAAIGLAASNGSGNRQSASNKQTNKSTGKSGLSQLDSDVTQSSLAKRRQLSQLSLHQRQQQNGNGSTGKLKKSVSSNLSSSTGTNQATSASTSNLARSSSKETNGKRSIYQYFKSHLLDGGKSTSKSSNNSSSSSSLNNKQSTAGAGSSASLPRNLSKNNTTRSVKLAQMEELRNELAKRDQELLAVGHKMKNMEEQQRDSQRRIEMLKDSLSAKEEHYNLLLADADELRRNLDERNKLLEKRSYQQTLRGGGGGPMSGPNASDQSRFGGNRSGAGYGLEAHELQAMVEARDKRLSELQRRVAQLDGLLMERDAQLERARLRLEHLSASSGAGHSNLGGGMHADMSLLNHLEESLGDREKQISLIRDQRDRAEHELNEERDSHERSIKEYKMKLNSLKFEMDKLQNRLNKASNQSSLLESGKYGSSSNDGNNELIKRLELDKRSLQLECERLKDRLESTTGRSIAGRDRYGEVRSGSALGGTGDYSVIEFERLQESLEQVRQELRRAQAECRMNEMERKRAQEEADKLSERYERVQTDMHKLKAKLENATSEREQLLEDYERQQQLISKSQTERDSALAEINSIKMDQECLQQALNKSQLQVEKLQAQLERTQLECKRAEERYQETSDELRRLHQDRSSGQRELKQLELNLQTQQLQQQRLQQDKELARVELDKLRDRCERLETELERHLKDRDMSQQQALVLKERLENVQEQASKWQKEREQLLLETHELRDRLHKQQKLQDSSEQETRSEVRAWKDKYERLAAQCEQMQQDLVSKEKEAQIMLEKLQRIQSKSVELTAKLEQSEMERERLAIEVEKAQQVGSRAKEDQKKWQGELEQLQEMYTKTNSKLLKLCEVEEKLRIDYDKCQMDLEVLRERYEKLQTECRRLQSERDRLQVEHERIRFDNERIQQSQGDQQATQDDFIRLTSELERRGAKLEQYQREINKLQLEKERMLLDSKSMVQQTEQQFQQQLVKAKAIEEKAALEMERLKIQLDKERNKHEQVGVDQEKLLSDKERLQQQLLLLQQEVDKFRSQQSSSVQETKKLHDDEMQRLLQELETVREKYTQQRKELLQLRELQQNHEIDKDILRRELESAEMRLEKVKDSDTKQKQDSERCMIELEKMRDKIERKQQELARAQKERNQFAQEITVLHQQINQLQAQYEQEQKTSTSGPAAAPTPAGAAPQAAQPQQQAQQQQQVKIDEFNKLKQMLVKSENDLQKTMAENQRFQMEVERLRLQLDDAAEYIAKIESDNNVLAKQNQEIIQQLKQSQQDQQQQTASAGSANQQQQAENQQEMKKMQDVIKKSAMEIQRLVEERNKLQEMNKELQRSLEQTKVEFNSTMDQYEAELERLQQEAQRQAQQQQQPQQQPSQQQQAAAPSDEYKVKFEKAVEAIRAFQKTSDDMKKEIIKLNERNKSLSEQNQQLMQNLKSTEESLQKQRQQQPAANQKADEQQGEQSRQQVAQLAELCNKLEKELGVSQEDVKQNQRANQQLKQALDKSQAEIQSIRSERDRFQAQLEKLIVELERREDETASLQAQQEKSGQGLQAKQNELAAYQKQLDEREKALEVKRQELQNLSKQIEQKQQQVAASSPGGSANQQELIAKLQQQIKVLEEDRAKVRGELERVRNELKQSQVELERLLKILSNSEEEKFNLTRQIEQLQAKLKSMPAAGSTQQQPHPPPAGGQMQKQQQQPQQPPPRAGPPNPQQQQPQQQRPAPQQQQQKSAGQSQQRSTGGGASGFISGFFQ